MTFSRRVFLSCVFLASMAVTALAPRAMAQTASGGTLPKRLIGDYGYWSRTQNPPYSSAQIPFDKLTQINHAGVGFTVDCSLSVPDGFLEPDLIAKAHASGVKVALLIGGDFPALAANPALIPVLIINLKAFIVENGYDGVDVDWEYPVGTEASTFIALLGSLRAALPSPRYVISADVAPWGGGGYAFSATTPLVDFFNVMTYDCAGPWTDDGQLNSPIFTDPGNPQQYECSPGGSVKDAIDIAVNQNSIPPGKLNIGTPFYGYYYENVKALFGDCYRCGNTVPSENYGTFIKPRVNALGWQSYRDEPALVPYLLRADGSPGFITYDDAPSTFYRVRYSVWERNLGGSFMWSLDADYDGNSQDLLNAMYQATTGGAN